MKEIFDNIDDYIIFFNKEKKIVHCNIKLLNKLGYELTDVVNEYIDDKIIKNNDKLIVEEFENLNKNYSKYKVVNKNNNIVNLTGKVFKTTFEREEVYCLILKEYEETDAENSKENINDLNKQLNDIKDKLNILNDCILNVNIPNGEVKGTKITRLGERKYENVLEERVSPHGKRYFWIGGKVKELEQENDSDIIVTPVNIDMTNNKKIEILKNELL